MLRVPLSPSQASALECAGLDLLDGDDAALGRAIAGRSLQFHSADSAAIMRALVAAANSEDAMAMDARRDADSRRFARGARDALTNLASRVAHAMKDQP